MGQKPNNMNAIIFILRVLLLIIGILLQGFIIFYLEELRPWCAFATPANREKAREAKAKGRASLAEWIHERYPLGHRITNRQIEDLIGLKLVTPDQVRAAGLQA